ncbi:2-phosphosulfolactate phosphatase [Alkalinema sp. FACHB-956]|uniref:2-phosphosulfolactate phosphatase n=1 Tax=Alkalinema sp. FACHB-956 TaxID=2692768 RepID=UPI00168611D2|nr:2-phosphosulfolactate phosphatase [Alkalinema sp. FACHB-956]MBD2325657.1 2-phosphosulfolactate phosphatase [Alkalinema sp. FACHB-956]
MDFDQAEFDIRCEWGAHGVAQLAPISDVVIIVDILSFSTCIEIATHQGAIVFPYGWKDDSAQAFARTIGAELATKRSHSGYSLSPTALQTIPAGTRLVLPSANGSPLSLAAQPSPTLAGCFRNCQAIAQAAMTYGSRIAVIPAGERWPDGSLRPSLEDWLGAGAIISYLQGQLSPEAQAAMLAYQGVQPNLKALIQRCSSGKELIVRDFPQDVALSAELNVSTTVPTLIDRAFIHRSFSDGSWV